MTNGGQDEPRRRCLPDPKICRAKRIGLGASTSFSGCLVNNPVECTFAYPFGEGFMCHHPRHIEIVGCTEKQQPCPIDL